LAIHAYEQALRHNPYSAPSLQAVANILRSRDQFANAIEYLKAVVKFDDRNGEVWATLGMFVSALSVIAHPLMCFRSLLFDAGQPPGSIPGIPASPLSFA
jgi:glucose repression mediator protein